ncbi:MAG: glutathione S-transferase family protein [Alphaproteobacteria bacterium]|nr:glutathione S-transferase family protein [Alphaproteobacteria bacterium]
MLTLYYAPGTCALAPHIALVEAGAQYETVRLDLRTEDQKKPQYLRVNPKARVPALVTEHGVLTETPAILYYIAQTHPAAKLAPSDPYWLGAAQAFNSYICSTLHVARGHRAAGHRWTDDPATLEAMKRKVPQTVGECYALIEGTMFLGPWVLGDYSICDAYLFTLTRGLAADGVDVHATPNIADHFKRMSERPAVQRAIAEETQPLQSAA